MNKTIKDILNNFIANVISKENYYLKLGKVLAVNPLNFTFSFQPNDGSPIQTVNMAITESQNSIVIVPDFDSLVMVAYTDKENPYCLFVETAADINITADETKFNLGLNRGLINIIEQTVQCPI